MTAPLTDEDWRFYFVFSQCLTISLSLALSGILRGRERENHFLRFLETRNAMLSCCRIGIIVIYPFLQPFGWPIVRHFMHAFLIFEHPKDTSRHLVDSPSFWKVRYDLRRIAMQGIRPVKFPKISSNRSVSLVLPYSLCADVQHICRFCIRLCTELDRERERKDGTNNFG